MLEHRSERGSAYLITLLVMAVTVVLGMSLMTSGMTEMDISGNYRNRAGAYYAADSGLEQTLADLRGTTDWVTQVLDSSLTTLVSPFPATVTITGHTINLNVVSGNVVPGYYQLGSAQSVGSSSYVREIYLPPTVATVAGDPVVTFRTRASGSGGAVETANQILRADLNLTVDRYSVWDNAVFANSGDLASLINGHVAVRGSIHFIGDSSNPMTVSFGGSADILNNYSDAPSWFGAGDAAKLPALGQVDVNGNMVDSLNAIVRSEYVDISLSGAAHIGEANDDSNTVKETIDAVRSDATVTPIGDVHADDWGAYDTPGLTFPSLSDPYTDSGGTAWSTHRDYLDTESMTVALSEISTDVADFSYSDGNGNSVTWDQSSRTMDITGIVRIDGDITLGKATGTPSKRAVNYTGTGTIFATGDIEIAGGIIPVGNYVTQDNIGLIAADDVDIDSGSQITVMAAIYAEDEIVVAKQTAVAGALVSDYFDLGSNVPGVFHVPSLSGNLPPGMPGGDPSPTISGVSVDNWFQERQ